MISQLDRSGPMGHTLLYQKPLIKPFKVLFVCESNAAWSLMGEAILNAKNSSLFHSMSTGLFPANAVDPMTIEQLQSARLPTEHCFPKSVQGFREDSLIRLDFIFSSMDLDEAGYSRGWPGNPTLVHWQIPDPVAFNGRENGRRNLFRSVFLSLQKRINLLLDLPPEKVAELSNQNAIYSAPGVTKR